MSEPTRIYRTRVVGGIIRSDMGVNYFTDAEEAKRWLDGYLDRRLAMLETTDWRREQSAEAKWSKGIFDDGWSRAVVDGVRVWESADEPLERLDETLAHLRGDDAE